MKKNNLLIISIIVLSIAILISGCSKNPDDAIPIEPTEPDVPKETRTDTTWHEKEFNNITKSSYLIGRFCIL